MQFYSQVADVYDEIDIDDTDKALLSIKQECIDEDFIENDLPSPKRARIEIGYTTSNGTGTYVNGTTNGHLVQKQQFQQVQFLNQQNRRKMTLVNRVA